MPLQTAARQCFSGPRPGHAAERFLHVGRPRPTSARSLTQYSSMVDEQSSYSIWLIPDPSEAFYKRVAAEIVFWAPKKNGPVFAPHVTLIGGIKGTKSDVLSKSEALAGKLKVPAVRLLRFSECGAPCNIVVTVPHISSIDSILSLKRSGLR
jgi:hypothetical protein